jgi:hypothetical protein
MLLRLSRQFACRAEEAEVSKYFWWAVSNFFHRISMWAHYKALRARDFSTTKE